MSIKYYISHTVLHSNFRIKNENYNFKIQFRHFCGNISYLYTVKYEDIIVVYSGVQEKQINCLDIYVRRKKERKNERKKRVGIDRKYAEWTKKERKNRFEIDDKYYG